jgi:hypothetical protein
VALLGAGTMAQPVSASTGPCRKVREVA